MHKLTFGLLCMFVFSLPWEFFVAIELIGSTTRLVGIAAVSTGVVTLVAAGRFRRPGLILCLTLAFTLLSLLSLLWTIAWDASLERVMTYGQLLGLVWLVWEFARTSAQQQSLMITYCLGASTSGATLLWSFSAGERVAGLRYTALSFDPNDLGLMLAVGIPMAWHLFMNRRGIIRFVTAIYVPLALVAILLTASRGAFLSSLFALSIVPLTLRPRSFRSVALTACVLLAAAGAAALIVPQYSWNRILTTRRELSGGTMSGRVGIWRAGMRAFHDRPVLGAGAGAFEAAVDPLIGQNNAPHNTLLAIFVEQGIVGFFTFGALLAACGAKVCGLPSPERKVWSVIVLVWLVGSMSLGWQYRKITWLLFGLLAVQASVPTVRCQRAEPARNRETRSRPSTAA